MRIRIRGIYATALSKLLIDHGYIITMPSETIARRLGIPIIKEPPDVTIKSEERDSPRIFVIGLKEAVEKITSFLDRHLRYSSRIYSRIGRGALVIGKVIEDRGSEYLIDFKSFKATMRKDRKNKLSVGEVRVFRIEAPPTNIVNSSIVSATIGVFGRYARVFYDSSPHSGSRFLSEERKRHLIELGRSLPRGFRVHRRSSAEYASDDVLLEEIRALSERLMRIMKRYERPDEDLIGEIIYEGEPFRFYVLSSEDLKYLDEIRSKVLPTLPGHHSRKSAVASLGRDYSSAVDVLEKALEIGVKAEDLSKAMLEYSLEREEIEIYHVKPYGASIKLKPGKIYKRSEDEIILYRELSRGKLDGLGIPISPGDYDLMHIYLDSRHILHEYHSASGELKGFYLNINTPPEILPGAIRYVDLFIDVIKRPNEEVKIIDREELERYKSLGLIPEALYERAIQEAEKGLEMLNSRTPRCFLLYEPHKLLLRHAL